MGKKQPPASPQKGELFGDTRGFHEMAARPPHEQLGVVLRFLREDVDTLDAAARGVWSSRLKALALRPFVSASGGLKLQLAVSASYAPLSVKSLKVVHAHLRSGIEAVLAPIKAGALGRAWPLPDLVGLGMHRDFDGAGFIWQWNVPSEEAFIILAAAQLVAEHADRIRACKLPGCGALFLATKRQEHCTPEHGQQARDQRKAARKGGPR